MSLALGVHRGDALGVNGGTSGNLDTAAGGNVRAIWVAITYLVGSTPVLTDSVGNTYIQIPTGSPVGTTVGLKTFYVLAPTTNASHNWSVSGSGTFTAIVIAAVTDSATPSFDSSNGAAYFDTTADPGSISVTSNSIVFSAISANRQTGWFSAPTGYTTTDSISQVASVNFGVGGAYKLSPSATEQPTWAGTGFQGGTSVTSIKPASGGVTVKQLAALGVG